MSVFKTKCFLMLRHPNGGVEDLARMKAAGFDGVFCNIGDHPPSAWEKVVRPRALDQGMFCGPWLRTQGAGGGFDSGRLVTLVMTADHWDSPLIVNSESELKGSGTTWTTLIRDMCAGYDAALSMEPWPFANVEWWPLREMPVLPQIFPAESPVSNNPEACAAEWHAYGISCVYFTYGSFGGMKPGDFDLTAPYSVYTGDDMGGNYAAWSPRAFGYEGCVESNGGNVTPIGEQDGVQAQYNWFLAFGAWQVAFAAWANGDRGAPPPIPPKIPSRGPGYNPDDINTWPWPDKFLRRETILREDHDAGAS